jgi:hypothetical protein
VVQIFSVFMPLSASVRALNEDPRMVTSVVVVGFFSTILHFFVFTSWTTEYTVVVCAAPRVARFY